MNFCFGSARHKTLAAERLFNGTMRADSVDGLNNSWRKKGPGRWRPPSPFSKRRQQFLEAFKENPINRLSGRELAKLSSIARRKDFKTVDQLRTAAEELIAARPPVFAGE